LTTAFADEPEFDIRITILPKTAGEKDEETVNTLCPIIALTPLYSAGVAEDNSQTLFIGSSSYSNLSATEKILIYQENKINPTGPFLINLFVGGGIGSIVMGDATGIAFLVNDIVFGLLAVWLLTYEGQVDPMAYAAVVIPLTISKIGQLITPFQYAQIQNTKLRNSLGLNFTLVSLPGVREELGIRVAATMSF